MAEKLSWTTIAVAVLAFGAGNASTPLLNEVGLYAKNAWIRSNAIRIEACAPLVSASTILRAYDQETNEDLLIEKVQRSGPNISTIKVINGTNGPLSNVVISVVPISDKSIGETEFLLTEIASNAIDARRSYEVKVSELSSVRAISTASMASGDGIIVVDQLNGPIDLQVELRSDEYTVRETFPRGCSDGDVAEPDENWHGFYLKTTGVCREVDVETGSAVSCPEEWEMPQKFFELMQSGALVDMTEVVNNEIVYFSTTSAKLVEGSEPQEYRIVMEQSGGVDD